MAAIPWNAFNKEELVEILTELERCGAPVEELWSESNVFYASKCSCPPQECALPMRVIELRDRAFSRIQRSPRKQPNPLQRWLRRPIFRRA